MRVDLGDGAVDEVQELVNEVHAPVEQHAAAGFAHAAPVAGNALAALHAGFNVEGLADRAVLQHLLHHEEILVPAAVLVHGELAARLLRNGQHLLELLCVEHHGLFADHVFPGAHRLDGEGLVEIVRHGENHGADLRVRQKRVERAVTADAVALRRVNPLGIDVIDPGEPEFLRQREELARMPAAHAAVANHCNGIHDNPFPFQIRPGSVQAQYISLFRSSKMIVRLSTSIAFSSPSRVDMRPSSCSIEMIPS